MSQLAHAQPQVLRFRLPLRVWLAAVVLIVGAAIALYFALSNDEATHTPKTADAGAPAGVRYDGGPDEGTRGIVHSGSVAGVRYDGGPEEGGHGISHSSAVSATPAGTRYDGGPDEGTRGMPSTGASSGAAAGVRFDGGPEEGSRGIGR